MSLYHLLRARFGAPTYPGEATGAAPANPAADYLLAAARAVAVGSVTPRR